MLTDTSDNIYRSLSPLWSRIVSVIAVSMSFFHLYTAAFGILESFLQRSIHLAFVLVLAYILFPGSKDPKCRHRIPLRDLLACGISLMTLLYIVFDHDRILFRMPYVTDLSKIEIVFGALLILLLIEATRRILGLSLVILVVIFIAYPFLGPYLPSVIATRGAPPTKLIDHLYLTLEGIFGVPLGVSSTFIFLFILLGAFLTKIGLIEFFSQFALTVAGSSRGGTAKVAVIASALFGTISGSAIGNAVTTGSFTVPMMVRGGFRPHMAAAIEAAASMGGQIMPPVMGAAAFIMAEVLGMPYRNVAIAAILPAIFYFFAIGVMVHLDAVKTNIELIPREKLPKIGPLLRERGHLLVPVAVLIYFLSSGKTPLMSGFWSILSAVFISYIRRDTRLTLKRLLEALEEGARNTIIVGVACAAVGIIIGVVSMTGLGLKIVSAILYLAGGKLIWTLFFTMVAALVLGTGLPTTPSYIIAATLLAPAIIKFGVPPLAAHMFVFWYAILSDLTPPTAIAPYATSVMVGADHTKTEWTAFMLALSGFIVPYVFCYEPSLLLIKPSVWSLLISVGACVVGITMLSASLIGYLMGQLCYAERGLLLVGGLLLIHPWFITDLIGVGILVIFILFRKILFRRKLPRSAEAG